MNSKMKRVDKALAEARDLADEQRARDNPLLGVSWLPDVQQRWRDAARRFKSLDFTGATDQQLEDFGDAIVALLEQRWMSVLSSAACDPSGRAYHSQHAAGFIGALADLLVHLHFNLMTPLVHLLTAPPGSRHPQDERADVIEGWLRALAINEAEFPPSASRDAVSAIVRAVLDADPSSLGLFSAWCASCGLLCPHRRFNLPTPWPLLGACPGCGSAGHVFHPLGRGVVASAARF